MNRSLIGAAVLAVVAGVAPADAVELGGPEVMKLSWNTRGLVASDIDGDGRTDLAVLNNDRAAIDLLYQRRPGEPIGRQRASGVERWQPLLDDAPFRRVSVATGIRMFALAIGDLDGDGRADLAYSGSPDGLTVRSQDAAGDFTDRRVFDVESPAGWTDTLLITDLDGDRRDDLAMLTESALLVYRQSSEGDLEGPRSYATADASCFGLQAVDVDRDGVLDLTYQVAQSPASVRLRLGLANGGYGPEQSFRIDETRGSARVIRAPGMDGPGLVRIQAATGLLELLEFGRDGRSGDWLTTLRPRLFSSRTDARHPASYAVADFDGDGRLDIAVADARGARTWLHMQLDRGEFTEAAEFPSLADVRSLTAGDWDGDGRAELFMASPRDRTIAWTGLTQGGRMDYPRPLPTRGRPFAIAADDLDHDGDLEIAYAFEDRSERGVVVMTRVNGGDPAVSWRESTIIVEALESAPRGLRVVDADQDGRSDLAVFGTHAGLQLLLQQPDGTFTEAAISSGFRQGLVDGVEPSALTTGDVTGDGIAEMLVADEGFARSLRVSGGALEVVDQYNARSSDTRTAAALVVNIDRTAAPEILLVREGGDQIQVLRRRRGGVFRYSDSVRLGGIDLVEARTVDLVGDGTPDVLLFGADRLAWLPVGVEELALDGVATHESDLVDVTYQLLGVGDLDDDGAPEVVAVDSRDSRVLEVLELGARRRFSSAMHFTVFDADPHYEGQRGGTAEPREIVLADLTGDGRDDIALLVHDRVLLYPQR